MSIHNIVMIISGFYMFKIYYIDHSSLNEFDIKEYQKKYDLSNLKIIKERILKDKLIDFIEEQECLKIEIIKDKKGKPFLKDNNLFINISHSYECVYIALCERNLGIDIEYINKYDSNDKIDRLKRKVFNDYDYEEYTNDLSFIRTWTIKEAFLKYIGIGLVNDLENIEIDYKNKSVSYKEYKNYYFNTFERNDYIFTIVLDEKISDSEIEFIKYFT